MRVALPTVCQAKRRVLLTVATGANALVRRPQFRVGFMVIIPHPGSVGRVEQKPRIHGGDTAIAKKLIVVPPVARRIESELHWATTDVPTQDATRHIATTTRHAVHLRAHEP